MIGRATELPGSKQGDHPALAPPLRHAQTDPRGPERHPIPLENQAPFEIQAVRFAAVLHLRSTG